MCITSLAPVCPLIAPATLVYYGVCQPMLRWLLIFVFKPKYDGGGDKWPQLHQIILSSMILGQVSSLASVPEEVFLLLYLARTKLFSSSLPNLFPISDFDRFCFIPERVQCWVFSIRFVHNPYIVFWPRRPGTFRTVLQGRCAPAD